MITSESARTLPDNTLVFARLDLVEVLAIQEKGEREFPGTYPKLGAYWDELYAVTGELARRRAEGVAVR